MSRMSHLYRHLRIYHKINTLQSLYQKINKLCTLGDIFKGTSPPQSDLLLTATGKNGTQYNYMEICPDLKIAIVGHRFETVS